MTRSAILAEDPEVVEGGESAGRWWKWMEGVVVETRLM